MFHILLGPPSIYTRGEANFEGCFALTKLAQTSRSYPILPHTIRPPFFLLTKMSSFFLYSIRLLFKDNNLCKDYTHFHEGPTKSGKGLTTGNLGLGREKMPKCGNGQLQQQQKTSFFLDTIASLTHCSTQAHIFVNCLLQILFECLAGVLHISPLSLSFSRGKDRFNHPNVIQSHKSNSIA